jgi:hypothetical protein
LTSLLDEAGLMLERPAGAARANINGLPWIRKKYGGGVLEMEVLARRHTRSSLTASSSLRCRRRAYWAPHSKRSKFSVRAEKRWPFGQVIVTCGSPGFPVAISLSP